MEADYQQFSHLLSVLGQIAILAFVIERVCDYIFDYHIIRKYLVTKKGLKSLLPLILSAIICSSKELDIVAALYGTASHLSGIILTIFFMAGGSGAAMVLFNNVLGISQSTRRERKELLEHDKRLSEFTALTEYKNASSHERSDHKKRPRGSLGTQVANLQIQLVRLGYLKHPFSRTTFDKATLEAVQAYQKYMGLKIDGVVGNITNNHIKKKRCGVCDTKTKDNKGAATTKCRWPEKILTYSISRYAPGISESRCELLIRKAFDSWASASNLSFRKVSPYEEAHIKILWELPEYEPVLEPYTVYAYGFFPCHGSRSGTIVLDESDVWLDDEESESKIGYFIGMTVLHEIGHALGLEHSNDPNDIMYSFPDSTGLRDLNESDKKRIKELYA